MSSSNVDDELIGQLDQIRKLVERIGQWSGNREERQATEPLSEQHTGRMSVSGFGTLEIACLVYMTMMINRLEKLEQRLSSIEERLSTKSSLEPSAAVAAPLAAGTLSMALLVLAGIATGVIYILTR
jgi:hypothetical protein